MEMIQVSDLDSLHRWRASLKPALSPSALPRVEFDLPGLGPQNWRLTAEAARLHRACGCTAAGLAMTLAVLVSIASIALDPRGPWELPPLSWAGYLLFVLLTTTAGKLAGVLWARRQMIRLASSAESMLGKGEAVTH